MVKLNQQTKGKDQEQTTVKKTKKINKQTKPANSKQPVQNEESDYQIFVSGIPYESTIQQLTEFFKECGTIIDIKLPKYQDTGRCRGYAHVRFSNESEVQQALKKNKGTLGTRYLTVAKAVGQKLTQPITTPPPIGCKTLFVKNLPYEITQQQIKKQFMHCGRIQNIRMVFDSFHHHFKGFCYIDFKDPSSLKAGLKMNGKQYEGRRLKTQFAVTKAKQGYKGYKKQE